MDIKQIKLKCRVAGHAFGDVVEVGNDKGQIPLEPKTKNDVCAKSLLAEGLAVVYLEPVAGTPTKLKAENAKLEKDNEELSAKVAELEKEIAELKKPTGKK